MLKVEADNFKSQLFARVLLAFSLEATVWHGPYTRHSPEVVCTVRLAIGFKQMLFIFPGTFQQGPSLPKVFSIYININFFSIFWDILIARYEFAAKNLKSFW
jgi:hypothetical protein